MSEEIIKAETVDVPDTEIAEVTPQAPSREELKAKGWSAPELDAAEKRGMIKKPEEKKETAKAETEQTDDRKKEEPITVERRVSGSWTDFEMTPEQEKVFLATFPPGTPQNGTYLRMKNERRGRQMAEAKAKELEAKIRELEAATKQVQIPVVDENGNEIDPDDKPMTRKEVDEYIRKKEEAYQREQEDLRSRGSAASEALQTQEEYAKSVYPDYDDVVKMAIELRNNPELLDTRWKKQQAERLWNELHELASNADKVGMDDLNAALISYELGKLHPNYGRSANHGSKAESHNDGKQRPDTKANGSLTPGKQMERTLNDTQRRVSSASIPGGGSRRTVAVEDVGVDDIVKMTPDQRAAFRNKHPERFAELLRG